MSFWMSSISFHFYFMCMCVIWVQVCTHHSARVEVKRQLAVHSPLPPWLLGTELTSGLSSKFFIHWAISKARVFKVLRTLSNNRTEVKVFLSPGMLFWDAKLLMDAVILLCWLPSMCCMLSGDELLTPRKWRNLVILGGLGSQLPAIFLDW